MVVSLVKAPTAAELLQWHTRETQRSTCRYGTIHAQNVDIHCGRELKTSIHNEMQLNGKEEMQKSGSRPRSMHHPSK